MITLFTIMPAAISRLQETANSVGRLAQLATDLRTSVAGFRLPESAATTTSVVGLREDAAELRDDATVRGERAVGQLDVAVLRALRKRAARRRHHSFDDCS